MEVVDRDDNKLKGFYGLWNTPNVEWTQITLNGIREHKLLSLLILNFTAKPAVPKLFSEWWVGELATWFLSQAKEECLQFAFSLKCCMYIWQQNYIIHWPKRWNIAYYQFNTDTTNHSGRILSFITTIRLFKHHPTTLSNLKRM